MIEQRSTGPGAWDPIAACSGPSPAFLPEWFVRRVIPGYALVASAGRNDARKQRDPASSSHNQHCVAIAEEAVTAANCLEISFTDQLDSDQGAYQNQQAAAWQVKIGDERVQSAEDVSRLDEQAGISRERGERSLTLRGGCLEGTCRGSAYGHDPTATGPAGTKHCGRPGGEFGPLGVHHVVADLLGLDWPESADADVQGEVNPPNSPGGQLLEDRLAKMQPRRGRSDRARSQGEDGWIPRPVASRVSPLANIRR